MPDPSALIDRLRPFLHHDFGCRAMSLGWKDADRERCNCGLSALLAGLSGNQPVDQALDIYVPGAWYCPKCQFHLSKATIFVASGEIGSSRDDVMRMTGELCPNDGEPMVRETWRERAESNRVWGESLMEEIMVATGALSLPAALEAVKRAWLSKATQDDSRT